MSNAQDHDRQSLASALQSALADAVRDVATKGSIPADRPPIDPRHEAAAPPAALPTRLATTTKSLSFSPALVRAILDGRKTQTRRLIRPVPKRVVPSVAKCVIAQPNDLLAVREAWARVEGGYVYAADVDHDAVGAAVHAAVKFRPAMYMPRDASRLMLRVTHIEAQRLQQITRDDVMCEGCAPDEPDAVAWFAALWDTFFTTPGERWADDPWVWVIRFDRV